MCALGSAGSELMFSSCKDLSLELASVQNHSLPIYIGIVPYCDFFFFFLEVISRPKDVSSQFKYS